jgi:hypothetical protein
MKRISLPKVGLTKFVGTSLCAAALAVFLAFAPAPVSAQEFEIETTCLWAGQAYSVGACLNNQPCMGNGQWGTKGTC